MIGPLKERGDAMSLSSEDRPIDPLILQRRASDPNVSAWVSASAGSGKTKVLTDRVLRLMLAGAPPARILCLTFTKAAAAEMAGRIADRLAHWAVADEAVLAAQLQELNGTPADAETALAARRLFAQTLDAPGGMKIQTIHAFCQSLLRRFPVEAGLAPHFEAMDDVAAERLLGQAKERVLDAARSVPDAALAGAVDRLTSLLGEADFDALLQSLAEERSRLHRLWPRGGLDALMQTVRGHLDLCEAMAARTLMDDVADPRFMNAPALRAALDALHDEDKEGRFDAVSRFLAADATHRLDYWPDYRDFFFTKDGKPRQRLMPAHLSKRFPRAAEDFLIERDRLCAAFEVDRRRRAARATGDALLVADALLTAYQSLKDRSGALDFDDLIHRTAHLLEGEPRSPGGLSACAWALYKLDGGLDHILIDEAQDTNSEQWRIVRTLAEEFFAGEGQRYGARSLFVVGDDKQSIFSFHGADPAAFARMRDHFAAKVVQAQQTWRAIDLTTSFRSVAAILRVVDATFADDRAYLGIAKDNKAPLRHTPHRRGMAGRVEIWPIAKPIKPLDPQPWSLPLQQEQPDVPMARLAQALARRIADALRDKTLLPARHRPLRAGDIMILVRRRNRFVSMLVRALKDLGTPVAGADRMALAEQLAVMDLLALGRFLLLPEDDLSLAIILRSPLVGLDEEGLFDLAHARPASLWGRLQERGDAGDNPFLRGIVAWLRGLLAQADYAPPYEIFSRALAAPCPADKRSGRRAMLARLGSEAADPLQEFLTACLTYEAPGVAPSLQGLIAWMENARFEIKREMEASGGEGEVRIMTVHGSKGLQAPLVILPDTMALSMGHENGLLWPDDDDEEEGAGAPLYAPRKSMRSEQVENRLARHRQRAEEEYRRLLYVALTRAEDWLILCGYASQRTAVQAEGDDGSWYALTRAAFKKLAEEGWVRANPFAAADDVLWQGETLILEEPQTAPPRPDAVATLSAPEAVLSDGAELPQWAMCAPPPEPSPPRPLMPSQPSWPEPSASSPLSENSQARFKRGLLMHKLLQWLPEIPPERRRAALDAWQADPGHGLGASEAASLADDALSVINAPSCAGLFGPGSQAETPIVGMVGADAIAGRIDRLWVSDDRIVIADYKTGRTPPRSSDEIPRAYIAQMATYRAALQALYPGRPVQCLLIWTQGPTVFKIADAQMDVLNPLT
jgi:ATP-dependent helicase/nuclease subunit A